MSRTTLQNIEIRGAANTRSSGALEVTSYDSRDRTIRALKTLGLFWGLALVSVPIIVAHWVLVPGFLIAGPVMAWRKYGVLQTAGGAHGTCPACAKEMQILLEPEDELPKRTYCPMCNAPIELVRV